MDLHRARCRRVLRARTGGIDACPGSLTECRSMSFTERFRRQDEREFRRLLRQQKLHSALAVAETSHIETIAVECMVAANGPEPSHLGDLDPSLSPETDA